jgi:hypothetical protein
MAHGGWLALLAAWRMAQGAWRMEFSAQTFEDVPRGNNGEKPK